MLDLDFYSFTVYEHVNWFHGEGTGLILTHTLYSHPENVGPSDM